MFDLFSRVFSVVFGLSFLASFGMSTNPDIEANIIASMQIGAGVAVLVCLCVNWRDYKG